MALYWLPLTNELRTERNDRLEVRYAILSYLLFYNFWGIQFVFTLFFMFPKTIQKQCIHDNLETVL